MARSSVVCLLVADVLVSTVAAPALGVQTSAGAALPAGAPTMAAAVGFFSSTRCMALRSVYPARDGTLWLFGVDWGYPIGDSPRASKQIARRMRNGHPVGPDIDLTNASIVEGLSYVSPIGETPSGDIILYCENNGTQNRVARLGSRGVLGVSGRIDVVDGRWALIDDRGIVHMVLMQGNMNGAADYIQMAATHDGLPVVRKLDYQVPFGKSSSAPSYLRWDGAYGASNGIAFYDEGAGRLLVAFLRSWDDSIYTLVRANTGTLALIDSGHVDARLDVYRTWRGPRLDRSTLVSDGNGGYWLITPDVSPNSNSTAKAYHIGLALKPIRPAAVSVVEVGPYASAPRDAVSYVQTSFKARDRWDNGAWNVRANLALGFYAFGRDGSFYYESRVDSLNSRVMQ